MKSYKYLLFGGGIMFLAACFSLFFSTPYGAFADVPPCDLSNCYVVDTTLSDFVQGNFYATGLSSVGDGAVQLIPMGLTAVWVTDTYRIGGTPGVVRKELAAVIYKDIIYVIGGIDGSGIKRPEIFSATTYITGPIKSPGFVPAGTLTNSIGLSGMAAVISTTTSGGFLYIIGGSDNSGTKQSSINYRHFNTNGTFDSGWTTVSDPNALFDPAVYASAVVRNGNLYVIGGITQLYGDDDYIYRFPINQDGSLGSRVDYAAALPGARNSLGTTIWTDESGTDHLHVMGGEAGSGSTRYADVPRTTFGTDDPNIPLIAHSSDGLQNTLAEHGAVQSSGRIFLAGGLEGISNNPINKVYAALIDPNGSLHDWGLGNPWLSSNPLPRPRRYHATVMNSGGEVYVIGGYGDPVLDSSGADTVYHGPTTGFGGRYAPSGRYLSRVIDLITLTGGQKQVNQIAVNTSITSPVTMTVQYKYSNTLGGLQTAIWNDLPPLTTGISVPNTFSVNFTAGLLQYRAFFTSSSPFDTSPILNAFQLRYPAPPTPTPTATTTGTVSTPTPTITPTTVISPDLTILGIAAAPVSVTTGYQTMTIRVANIGNQGFSPIRLVPAPVIQGPRPQPPTLKNPASRQPGGVRAPAAYFAWISPYIDREPTGVTDLGNCLDNLGALKTPPYVYVGDLPIGTYKDYSTTCWLTAGSHTFYAQVDTCDNPNANPDYQTTCSTSIGYVIERNETNNIWGPVSSGSIITQTLGGFYFPYIRKSP